MLNYIKYQLYYYTLIVTLRVTAAVCCKCTDIGTKDGYEIRRSQFSANLDIQIQIFIQIFQCILIIWIMDLLHRASGIWLVLC